MISKGSLFLLCMQFVIAANAQQPDNFDNFRHLLTKQNRLPEQLKYNCEWLYAIVQLKGDAQNRVKSVEVVNEAPEAFKKAFDFLIGYRFSKTVAINKHPVVFYYAIDNNSVCEPKSGEKRFYLPDDVVRIMYGHLSKILERDPRTIFVPGLMYEEYYSPEQKK